MQEKKYFRLLEEGEKRQAGDLFTNLINGQLLPVDACNFGTEWGIHLMPHFRPVQVDEWIPYAEQKPTEADFAANVNGYIQVMAGDGHSRLLFSTNRIDNAVPLAPHHPASSHHPARQG
jgi:hypothetical protein